MNINDDKDIIITLQFLQKFENSILSIGFEDYKTGIINSYGINYPILDKEHNNIIYIKILNQYKIEELIGVYRIRVFFYNTQYPSFLSKMKLIVSNNISLYENKQRFFKSNNINKIGIILKNPIQKSQIEKLHIIIYYYIIIYLFLNISSMLILQIKQYLILINQEIIFFKFMKLTMKYL